MTWTYVSIDEANEIMRRHNPFDDVRPAGWPFPGSLVWEDIKRLANNAIMCAHEHKDYEQLMGRLTAQLLTGQEP